MMQSNSSWVDHKMTLLPAAQTLPLGADSVCWAIFCLE